MALCTFCLHLAKCNRPKGIQTVMGTMMQLKAYFRTKFFLILFSSFIHAELKFGSQAKLSESGVLQIKGIEETGALTGLRFSNAASISDNGNFIRSATEVSQGAWLNTPGNLTGGLVFKNNGITQAHFSPDGVVRLRGSVIYDIIADIDVDANRDGNVDDADDPFEESWGKGASSTGALVLPNWDDDDNNKIPDNWFASDWTPAEQFLCEDEPPTVSDWDVTWFGCDDEPIDKTINTHGDVDDIAPLLVSKFGYNPLPGDLTVTLTVSRPDHETSGDYFFNVPPEKRVRIFLPSGVSGNNRFFQAGDNSIIGPEDGVQALFNSFPNGSNEHDIGIFAGNGSIQFGIEGLEFGAEVDIELAIWRYTTQISSDKVRIRVSPFILLGHEQRVNVSMEAPGQTVQVHGTLSDMDDIISNIELVNALDNSYGNRLDKSAGSSDAWLQDGYEIGYASAPYGKMSVILSLPRALGRSGILREFVHTTLLGPGVAVCPKLEIPLVTSQDDGGNIEMVPQFDRPGALMHGSSLMPEIPAFFEAQNINTDGKVQFNTNWLCVGHVDEVVSITPDLNRVLVADSEIAWALLLWAKEKDPSAIMMEVPNWDPGVTVGSVISSNRMRTLNVETAHSINVMHPANLPTVKTALSLPSPESVPSNSGGAILQKGGAFVAFFPNTSVREYRAVFLSSTEYRLDYREAGSSLWISDGTGLITQDEVFENALCFILKNWWSGTAAAGNISSFTADPTSRTLEAPVLFDDGVPHCNFGDVAAFTNNIVNCFVDGPRVIAAEINGPHIEYKPGYTGDIMKDYAQKLFELAGYTDIRFVDEHIYHDRYGSVHCGTNSRREIPSYNWWEK